VSEFNPSRLWPVLLVLVTLLSGAAGVEIYLKQRDPRVVNVAIRASDTPEADEDDSEEGAGELAFDRAAPESELQAQAREAGRRGDPNKAITLLQQDLASRDSVQARAELGYWLLVAERPADAVSELSRVVQADRNNDYAQLNLGVALRRTGDLPGALQALQAAVQLKPTFGSARHALGILLLRMGKIDEAIEQLKAAAATGGNDARARASVVLGRAYLKSGKDDEAERVFNKAVEWAPAVAEIRLGIGRAYLSTGQKSHREAALRALQQAADVAPDLPQPHSLLARAHELAGDNAAARREYELTLQIDPNYSYARRHLIRLALDEQDLPRARMHADLLLQTEDTAEHRFLAGMVAAQSERFDDARKQYALAIEKAGGRYPEALFNLGLLAKSQKQYDEAVAQYRKALEQRPDYVEAANNMGLAYAEMGKPSEAEAAYRSAIAIDGKYAAAWFNLGNLKQDGGDHGAAIDAFQRALAIRPGYKSALVNLGVAYRQAGQLDNAIATARKLTELEPRYVRAWYNLGVALGFAGRLQEARDAYQQALEIDEEHWPSLKNKAFIEQRMGQLADARAGYEAFLDHSPGDSEVRLALAGLYASQGDPAGCSRQAQLVLNAEPNHAQARQQLQKCNAQ
jgi:superkiller protein 3